MTEAMHKDRLVQPKRPLWRRLAKWTIRVVVVLLVLGVLAWSIGRYVGARRLKTQVDRIRAAGEPLTFADLAALLPDVPREDDAGPFYLAALELCDSVQIEEVKQLAQDLKAAADNGRAPPHEVLDQLQRTVDANGGPCELLDRGADKSGCSKGLRLQEGALFSPTRFSSMADLVRINSLRIRNDALNGRGNEAVDSVIVALKLLRLCDRQPYEDHLPKLAFLQLMLRDLQFVLEVTEPSDVRLGALAEAIEDAASFDLKRIWLGDRVFVLEAFRTWMARYDIGPFRGPHAPPRMWERLAAPARLLETSRFLEHHTKRIEAADHDWPDVLRAVDALHPYRRMPWDSLPEMAIPATRQSAMTFTRALATARSTQVVVLIERFRLAQGRLPTSLAELGSHLDQSLPIDPYTGDDLIYHVTDDGYAVNGLGPPRVGHSRPDRGPRDDCGFRIRE